MNISLPVDVLLGRVQSILRSLFLLVTYPVIASSIYLVYLASCFLNFTQDSLCSPPANVFGLQPQRFGSSSFHPVLSCSTQPKHPPDEDLVSQLSWKKIERKRRVASFTTQPCNILLLDGRDTRNFGSCCCCKNIRTGNFTKTLASNTTNGQETSLYS